MNKVTDATQRPRKVDDPLPFLIPRPLALILSVSAGWWDLCPQARGGLVLNGQGTERREGERAGGGVGTRVTG